MSVFNRLPLHWRLTLLITGVCAVALGFAFAGYVFLELWRLRSEIAGRIAPMAGRRHAAVGLTVAKGLWIGLPGAAALPDIARKRKLIGRPNVIRAKLNL